VVEDFSLRRTTLRDIDGTIHTVPNGQIIVASNLSRGHEPAANVDATEPPEAPEGDIGQ
jgi:small-conductance mechanosensitive channel